VNPEGKNEILMRESLDTVANSLSSFLKLPNLIGYNDISVLKEIKYGIIMLNTLSGTLKQNLLLQIFNRKPEENKKALLVQSLSECYKIFLNIFFPLLSLSSENRLIAEYLGVPLLEFILNDLQSSTSALAQAKAFLSLKENSNEQPKEKPVNEDLMVIEKSKLVDVVFQKPQNFKTNNEKVVYESKKPS
jgi:hypothetical protein